MADKTSEAEAILRGSSGLRDDFDGTITAFKFGYDTDYMDGKTCIAIIEIDVEGSDDTERVLLSTGTGWEPADRDGKKAQREKGDNKPFSNQCAYSLFTTAAMDAGAGELLIERVREGTMTWDSALWDGKPRFHFNQQEYKPYGWKEGENLRSRLVPTDYLGLAGEKTGKSEGKKKKDKKSKDTDDE